MNKKYVRFTIILTIHLFLVIALLGYYGTVMLSSSQSELSSTRQKWRERGSIVDRNGNLLAMQVRRDTVTVWKPEIKDEKESIILLAKMLNLNKKYIKQILDNKNNKFSIIKRTISDIEKKRIQDLKKTGALRGIHLIADTKREYPNKTLASQIIGYAGIDNIGLSGIEYVFDKELSRTSKNEPLGNQVTLTIDVEVQQYSEFIARKAVQEEKAESCLVVIMKGKTGEIFALTSYPDFDPNKFIQYSNQERKNRVISDVYEPGSVFKIFSISSLLQLGVITPQEKFDATGPYQSDQGFQIRDIHAYGHISPREIIKFSSNVGAAYAAEKASPNAFFYMLKRFGFGEKTKIKLNGESIGILVSPHKWSARSRQTIAIGQEIGVTAIQLVSAATVFANHGILLKPLIVKNVITTGRRKVQTFSRQAVREVISDNIARTMLDYMHEATQTGGTASRLRIEDLNISAKTGTAEIYDKKEKKYSSKNFIASTLALFPTEDPEFIVYVALYKPSAGRIYGGQIVAPLVKKLILFLLSYYNLRPDTVILPLNKEKVSAQKLPSFRNVLPDFRGLSKRSILPLLSRADISVEIKGSGWVKSQSPPPETKIKKGMKLILILE